MITSFVIFTIVLYQQYFVKKKCPEREDAKWSDHLAFIMKKFI